MEDLLLYAVIIALAYYVLIHLPKQSKLTTKPTIHSQSTQTETLTNADENHLESTLDQLITNIQQLNHQLK